jgi:hypothetical protein
MLTCASAALWMLVVRDGIGNSPPKLVACYSREIDCKTSMIRVHEALHLAPEQWIATCEPTNPSEDK